MEDVDSSIRTRPTLLITGVDGVLGANLALQFSTRFSVVGLYRNCPVSLSQCRAVGWDPAAPASLRSLVDRLAPQWIIHCGQIAQGSWESTDMEPDERLELATCRVLARATHEAGARLTVISTDAVFGGSRLFRSEEDKPNALGRLGRVAMRIERTLLATGAFVVRTHAYGWAPRGCEPGFVERIWQALGEGMSCPADPNRCATPILATDLAELLLRAYRRGLTGLYHIAGAERISAYRFARQLANVFVLPNAPVSAEGALSASPAATGCDETSLDTRRARRDLGRSMPMLQPGLERFAEQAHNGHRLRLQSPASPFAVVSEAA